MSDCTCIGAPSDPDWSRHDFLCPAAVKVYESEDGSILLKSAKIIERCDHAVTKLDARVRLAVTIPHPCLLIRAVTIKESVHRDMIRDALLDTPSRTAEARRIFEESPLEDSDVFVIWCGHRAWDSLIDTVVHDHANLDPVSRKQLLVGSALMQSDKIVVMVQTGYPRLLELHVHARALDRPA